MTKMTYREALRGAMRDAMRADPRVFLMAKMWATTAAPSPSATD
jgi:hypothetical protein